MHTCIFGILSEGLSMDKFMDGGNRGTKGFQVFCIRHNALHQIELICGQILLYIDRKESRPGFLVDKLHYFSYRQIPKPFP